MKPIALFYHCLFYLGDPPQPLPAAPRIVAEQMEGVRGSGLLARTAYFLAGINGGDESAGIADALIPHKAEFVLHGLACHTENLTLLELARWLPGHEDWYVLYFHAKGATRPPGDRLRENWRRCMMRNLVLQWRRCVSDLDAGFESVGCHWMTGHQTPPGQSVWAGNFWWAKAAFLLTLPSILERDRIRTSGIGAVESRYESEVWIGNGPRLPRVNDYHPAWIDTCTP